MPLVILDGWLKSIHDEKEIKSGNTNGICNYQITPGHMFGRTFQNLKIKGEKLRKCIPGGNQVGTDGLHQNPWHLPACHRRDKRIQVCGGQDWASPCPTLLRIDLRFNLFMFLYKFSFERRI